MVPRRALVMLLVLAIAMLALPLAASAGPPGLESNPANSGAAWMHSNNCIGYYSAGVIHNGVVVRTQDRAAEIAALRDSCVHPGP